MAVGFWLELLKGRRSPVSSRLFVFSCFADALLAQEPSPTGDRKPGSS